MNLFTAASSSDDEENEHPLRSFIPAAAKSPQPISPWKWGLPGDEEDDEEEEGGREEARQQREAATTTETKASAPAAGTAAARKTPSKPLAFPKDAHEASRGETEQVLTHLGAAAAARVAPAAGLGAAQVEPMVVDYPYLMVEL